MKKMRIDWPPEKTYTFKAERLVRENSIVISAKNGGNPNRGRREDRGEER